jgi:hypothetical protein
MGDRKRGEGAAGQWLVVREREKIAGPCGSGDLRVTAMIRGLAMLIRDPRRRRYQALGMISDRRANPWIADAADCQLTMIEFIRNSPVTCE